MGGGGGRLGLNWPVCVCPNVKEMGSFQPQVNDMNEKMSFKMGIKFAASFYMGKKEGVIQNGAIFKSQTHTPGHFDNGVAPHPPGYRPAICCGERGLQRGRGGGFKFYP